jgi:hypothetical protein
MRHALRSLMTTYSPSDNFDAITLAFIPRLKARVSG